MNYRTIWIIQITFPLRKYNIIHHYYGTFICNFVRSKGFQYNLEK